MWIIHRLFIFSIVFIILDGCAEKSKSDKVFDVRGSSAWHTFEAIKICIEARQSYYNCIESGGKKCSRNSC